VLQCVAVCCSVLQCVAVCCSALQCVAVCYEEVECIAVCEEVVWYSVLQTGKNGSVLEEEQIYVCVARIRCVRVAN